MGKQSQAWKDVEREVAGGLKGVRVVRADRGTSDTDVRVPDFPGLKIDAKYRAAWSHATYLAEVRKKYVKEPGQMAVLVTKAKRQRGAIVCLSLEDFATILDAVRELRTMVRQEISGEDVGNIHTHIDAAPHMGHGNTTMSRPVNNLPTVPATAGQATGKLAIGGDDGTGGSVEPSLSNKPTAKEVSWPASSRNG